MNDDLANDAHAARRWPRLRFSLLTLLILMTFACVALAWLILHRKSDIVALLEIRESSTTNDIVQGAHLSRLKDPVTMQEVLRDPNISSLPLVRDQADPATWLTQDLAVSFLQNSEILEVRINVPARYSGQGQAVLSRVIEEYLAAEMRADPAQKIKLIQHPVITNARW
jgi:hypothetical protein